MRVKPSLRRIYGNTRVDGEFNQLALKNDHPHPQRPTDRFTARAGACVLLLIAAGFLFFAVQAFATGCLRLKSGPHGAGVVYCSPETAYWVASTLALALGCALVGMSYKLFRFSARRSRAASAER